MTKMNFLIVMVLISCSALAQNSDYREIEAQLIINAERMKRESELEHDKRKAQLEYDISAAKEKTETSKLKRLESTVKIGTLPIPTSESLNDTVISSTGSDAKTSSGDLVGDIELSLKDPALPSLKKIIGGYAHFDIDGTFIKAKRGDEVNGYMVKRVLFNRVQLLRAGKTKTVYVY